MSNLQIKCKKLEKLFIFNFQERRLLLQHKLPSLRLFKVQRDATIKTGYSIQWLEVKGSEFTIECTEIDSLRISDSKFVLNNQVELWGMGSELVQKLTTKLRRAHTLKREFEKWESILARRIGTLKKSFCVIF